MQVMPDGGTMDIQTEVLEGGIKVSVGDTGPGFAKEISEKLLQVWKGTYTILYMPEQLDQNHHLD